MAHGFDRPQGEGELFRRPAGLCRVRGDHRLGGFLAGFPGLLAGYARGVEAVEVAAGGQGVGIPDRVAAVGGRPVPAGERRQQALDLALRAEIGVPAVPLFQLRGERRIRR